jgi:endonuclease/exonuclease/phosphatase (EEP) superfamily protein YafD
VDDPFPDPRRPRKGRDQGERGRPERRERRSGGGGGSGGGRRGARQSERGGGWSDVTPQGLPPDGAPPATNGRPGGRATVPRTGGRPTVPPPGPPPSPPNGSPAGDLPRRGRQEPLGWLDDGGSRGGSGGGGRRKQPADLPPFALYTTPPGGTTFPRRAEPDTPPGLAGPGVPAAPGAPALPGAPGAPGGPAAPGPPGGGPALTPAGGFSFGPEGDRRGPDTAPPMPPGRRARRGRTAEPPPEPAPPPAPRSRRGLVLLTLASLLLVLWSVSCLVDLEHPYLAAAAALSPTITALAVPIVALGVGRRHPVPAALATLAGALPWVLVASYGAPGPGPTTPEGRLTVRVMTVNADDGRADAARIAGLARENEIDVVVVTELTSRLAHDLTVAGLNNVVTARQVEVSDTGGDGIGLWSSLELTDGRTVPGLSRPAIAGVLSTGTGEVGIVATHATGSAITPGAGWRKDLEALPGLVPEADDGRGIIVGDFNTTPWSPAFRRLASGRWRDAADVVGRGLRPTWPSWSPLPISPLDHVLVSGGLGVSEVNSAEVPGSVHRALIVSVVVPPKQTG